MSNAPTGTATDEDRLFALEAGYERDRDSSTDRPGDDDSTYVVDVAPLVERLESDLGPGTVVDWAPDASEADPMLVFGPLDEAGGIAPESGRDGGADAEDRIADAAYPRRLYETDGDVFAPVPDPLLEIEPPDGLGLDLDAYDPETPLLFEGLATGRTIGLIPVRFADGTPYAGEPLPGVAEDSDPVAEAALEHGDHEADRELDPTPRPETVDAPLDADLLEDVAADRGVEPETLVPALETLARRDLVGEAETAPERPPLPVDDRAVCVIADDTWEAVASDLADEVESVEAGADEGVDVTETVLEAVRAVHERQAKRLLDEAGREATDYRGFDETGTAVVTEERETAEWDGPRSERGR